MKEPEKRDTPEKIAAKRAARAAKPGHAIQEAKAEYIERFTLDLQNELGARLRAMKDAGGVPGFSEGDEIRVAIRDKYYSDMLNKFLKLGVEARKFKLGMHKGSRHAEDNLNNEFETLTETFRREDERRIYFGFGISSNALRNEFSAAQKAVDEKLPIPAESTSPSTSER